MKHSGVSMRMRLLAFQRRRVHHCAPNRCRDLAGAPAAPWTLRAPTKCVSQRSRLSSERPAMSQHLFVCPASSSRYFICPSHQEHSQHSADQSVHLLQVRTTPVVRLLLPQPSKERPFFGGPTVVLTLRSCPRSSRLSVQVRNRIVSSLPFLPFQLH